MKLLIFTFAIVVAVSAQYDSPVPPRPVIPGAAPVQRVTLRRRQQFSQQDDAPAVPQRRLGGRGGPRRLPPPILEQSVQKPRPAVYQEPFPARQPTPSPTIPPRPVIEDEDDDEEEVASTVPPTQPPQTYRPIPYDFPQPTRQQFPRPAPPQISIDDEPVSVEYVRQPRPQPVQTQVQFRPQTVQNPIQVRPPVQNSYQRPQPVQNSIQEQRNQPERQRPTQQFNRQQQVSRPVQKQVVHSKDEPNPNRPKKPVSQILKKYRDENEDGSITWGFENDDGTFKEETIGTDCVTRGKYGYIDPDGVRREYSYSSGIPCDKTDSEPEASNSEGYIDYTNNKYVFPNGDTIDLDNMVRNRARKPVYRN